jgi:hypothetical protein
MADKRDALDQAHQFLGNIDPVPEAKDHVKGQDGTEETDDNLDGPLKDDARRHSGTRDVDEGGGVASEVGGTATTTTAAERPEETWAIGRSEW